MPATGPLKTYSGGMRRRLDLAAALVARPSVLFLDEPTTGLDLRSRNDLWEMIEGLVDGGTTVLLTTQYLEEADRLAQRIAVVDHGRVIAEGTPAQLKADLGATVLDVGMPDPAAATSAAEVLAQLGTKPPTVEGSSIELAVDDGPRAAMEALRMLDAQALSPTTFVLREPSLDDVFLALTGKRTETEADDETAKKNGAQAAAGAGPRPVPRQEVHDDDDNRAAWPCRSRPTTPLSRPEAGAGSGGPSPTPSRSCAGI